MNKIWRLSHPNLRGAACLPVQMIVCSHTSDRLCGAVHVTSVCPHLISMVCTVAFFLVQTGQFGELCESTCHS